MNILGRLDPKNRTGRRTLFLAAKTFLEIDGIHWAGAFAFNAFFSLFPLLVLLVTITSFFVEQEQAGTKVIAYMEHYLPISGEIKGRIFKTIAGVVDARKKAGIVAFLILLWSARQCFTSLIRATNQAWGVEGYNWWRLPLKSLLLISITAGGALLGMAATVLAKMTRDYWLSSPNFFNSWVSEVGSLLIPMVMVFLFLALFYRLAPRRPTRLAEVWAAALVATALLYAAEFLFVLYLDNFATLNAVYGTFGGIMALLLWIYLSGCVIIFGACLCAVQGNSLASAEENILGS